MNKTLQIHPNDNLIVAIRDLKQGETFHYNGQTIVLPQDIQQKHKFTTGPIPAGGHAYMYGVLVGTASQDIAQGELISTFNLKHESEAYSVSKKADYKFDLPSVDQWKHRTFNGFVRNDGRVGTRNFWLVVPLVFCENRNVLLMKDAFEHELGYGKTDIYRGMVRSLLEGQSNQETKQSKSTPFENVDGVKFITHEMGCGGTNADCATLAELLAGYAINPNVAGITVLSLGCQKTQFDEVKTAIDNQIRGFDKPIYYFNQQTHGTEQQLMADAIKATFEGLQQINQQKRQAVPLSKLNLGLKCGGSDGFSGISANPALGYVSDVLVALEAQTLLAEFPELCGVEQELIDRCQTTEDATKFAHLMGTYAAAAEAQGAGFDMNPSKGNIKDGLITDAIKSAGAAKKAGYASIAGVLDYAEQPTKPGLHLLCTPGNDVLATTGMAASGANLIVFTTGLGTPTGNVICPTVKASTNTALRNRMPDVIDFDCGSIIEGTEDIRQNGERMLEFLIEIANGKKTKAEELGQDDFIPWRKGLNL